MDERHVSRWTPAWVRLLFGLFFAIFICGGLFFGYLFYQTVKEIVAYVPMPPPLAITGLPASGDPGKSGPSGLSGAGDPAATAPQWNRRGRVNILLLGTDERDCEPGARSDTMMIVSIDPDTKSANILSIPRDLWVSIPGYGQNRINAAHAFGEAYKVPGGGPALARQTVQNQFGVPIHYYVRINVLGLRNIIDLIGGIDIDVERRIYDATFPNDTCGTYVLDIPAGPQHMDGKRALEYARSRHSSDDFDRSHRQQKILLAMRDKVMSLGILPRLPQLYREFGNTVKTDLQLPEILALAGLGTSIPRENIHTYAIDSTMTHPWTRPDGASVLIPLNDRIGPLIQEVFRPTRASQ